MATFKKRIEYIASTEESPTRFTLENFNVTPNVGDIIEIETENQFYEVPSANKYEFIANYGGVFYSIFSTSGLFALGGNTSYDTNSYIDTTKYQNIKLTCEIGVRTDLYIDDVLACHRINGLSTYAIQKFYFMWGKGNSEFDFAHKKKFLKIKINGVLVYDFIPVLDNNDVPCWFNRVDSSLLYANEGYTPTVYGNEVPMYASEVEYIGSSNDARFTISNLGVTTSKNLLIESDIKWINYPNSINGEYRLDLVGGWQGANSSGKWMLATGIAGGNASTTEFQNIKFEIDNINQKTTIYVNGEESVTRTTNPLTIDYVNVFYGTYGSTTYYANNIKKYIRIFIDNKLVRDYIPVLDNNDVPAFYDKVTDTLLYADAGYTPTIVGGIVEYECGDGLRERQLLIANKTILPYYCELEYISAPCRFEYLIPNITSNTIIETETEISLNSVLSSTQLELNGSTARWYGIDANGYYTLGNGITSTNQMPLNTWVKIRDVQNEQTATNYFYVNGNLELTRSGMWTVTDLYQGMFGGAQNTTYTWNIKKKYHKVWVNGELIYDFIPVLDYDRVPCFYDRVNNNLLYAFGGNTPTVWGREIHPIERLYVDKNYYYNLGDIVDFNDKVKLKVMVIGDGGNADNVFLGSTNGTNSFTVTYNLNKNLVYRWFSSGSYYYTAGIAERGNIDTIEFCKDYLLFNGTNITNFYSDVTKVDNTRLFGANNNSALKGWLYFWKVESPDGTLKQELIPFVDETGTAGLFDTVSRTIQTKAGAGIPSYDDILLESIENKVLTDSNTGGAYISIPYQANKNTQINCRFKITDVSQGRYMYGSTQYRLSHSSNNFTITYGAGYYFAYTTDVLNTIRNKRDKEKNYLNDVQITSSSPDVPGFSTSVFAIFSSGSANNSMVGLFNWYQIGENNQLLYDLVPTLRNGVIGMVNTVDGVMYPNLRAGVDFFPNFLPQLRKFDPYDKIDYFSITIDTRKIVNNKTYDFVNGTPTNTNYIVDWGDGQIEQAGTTHTYAEAGEYEVRFIPTDVGNFPWLRFSTGQSTTPSCLISVNNRYPKMASTIYDVPNWFTGCTNLVSIYEDFLQNNRHITNLASIFYTCAKLPAIGKNFFKGMTKLRALSYGFNGTALAEIPAGLLDDCTDLRVIERMFSSTPITSIPAGLFDHINKAGVTSLVILFSSTNIKSVPAGLFDGFINVTNVTQIFNECSELETLPDLLFNDLRKVTNFRYCFYNDSKLTIPANLFCNEATDMATRFTDVASVDFTGTFSRLTWTGTTAGTAPQLWNYTMPNSVTPGNCYSGAGNNTTSLTNYSSIPNAWGGPA